MKWFGSVKQYIKYIIGLHHDGLNSFIILTHWLSVIQQSRETDNIYRYTRHMTKINKTKTKKIGDLGQLNKKSNILLVYVMMDQTVLLFWHIGCQLYSKLCGSALVKIERHTCHPLWTRKNCLAASWCGENIICYIICVMKKRKKEKK